MAKKKQKQAKQSDSAYFLKILLFMVLGSLWIKATDGQSWQLPIPVGLLIGLVLVSHDHFKIDRKIEYAVLLVSMLVGFWLPIGIYISV
ncbi:hypothetical protein KC950_00760 [Candidatus Saccharibacteria bacterium]|nr:hypothetical protein [Candidatus Saccharibacteria bacterium]